MISKLLQILGLQPRISQVSVEQFILTAGQKNFGNKIRFQCNVIMQKSGGEITNISVIFQNLCAIHRILLPIRI